MSELKRVDTFYSQFEENKDIYKSLEEYSKKTLQQIYVLKEPLGENNYEYEYEYSFLILIPDNKLLFVNTKTDSSDEFMDYVNDVLVDIDSISVKYDFRKLIGRYRTWEDSLVKRINIDEFSIDDFQEEIKLHSEEEKRKVNVIISMLIGSINSVNKIGDTVPENVLDRVKQKIVLFDGDQTRFIFKKTKSKRVSIQGLAGTGKTELLLHKLKELYLEEDTNKIAFTCFNKILANSLKKRVPEFFTFMKVAEQIEWEEKLWVLQSWGSEKFPDSGLYSYICNYYGIPFERYSKWGATFEEVCNNALKHLEDEEEIQPCFDYILIDESQDFPKSFFNLCEKVVKKTVYMAGDIFQNITDDTPPISSVSYLLNRCYRTDNRTLMFSHALGMGLFERPVLRWLNDEEWEIFGYNLDKNGSEYHLSRNPLRRFDDIDEGTNPCAEIINCETDDCTNDVIKVMEKIKEKNPTVAPDDIGIVYITPTKDNYSQINNLSILINNNFGWETTKGYDTKEVIKDTVFITNKYNIKGLEFPFIICVANKGIKSNPSSRNTLYMAMTRSFLSSYLLIYEPISNIYDIFDEGLTSIIDNNELIIQKPKPQDITEKDELIKIMENDYKSQYDIMEQIFNENKIPSVNRPKLRTAVNAMIGDSIDKRKIKKIIIDNKDNV